MDTEDRAEEAATRFSESILAACQYKAVPEELVELLADNDGFLNLLIPDDLSKPLHDFLREQIIEHLAGIIYLVVAHGKKLPYEEDRQMRRLMWEVDDAIGNMRREEENDYRIR